MGKGWISIHRKLQECWIWNGEPFTRGQAWVDILLSATHDGYKKRIGNSLVTIHSGQLHTSIIKLSQRWQWSEKKVRRYLELLEGDGMITYEGNAHGTTLTIVNYGFYQGEGRTVDAPNDPTEDGQTTQQRTDRRPTYNNDNNNNNDHNGNNIPRSRKHKYGEYEHVLLTDTERDKLFAEYGELESLEAIKYLDEYIEMKGYKAKSHYLCIRKWVFDAVKRDRQGSKPSGQRDLIQELMNV